MDWIVKWARQFIDRTMPTHAYNATYFFIAPPVGYANILNLLQKYKTYFYCITLEERSQVIYG